MKTTTHKRSPNCVFNPYYEHHWDQEHPQQQVPYRRARFTPPGVKYLILGDFHFRIDPQIINYNGLSFHTSMAARPRCATTARRPGRGQAGLGPCRHHPAAQAQPLRLRQLSNHNRTDSAKASPGLTAICWSVIRTFSLKPTFR